MLSHFHPSSFILHPLLKELGCERADEREDEKDGDERNGNIIERSFQAAPLMGDGAVIAKGAGETFAFHLDEQNGDDGNRDDNLDDIDDGNHIVPL